MFILIAKLNLMSKLRSIHPYFAPILILSLLWFLSCSFIFPITMDEAYYHMWGKNPAFGYFDHPPAVAWISYLSNIDVYHWFNGRLATAFLASISFVYVGVCLRLWGLKNSAWLCAFGLTVSNLGALISGILTTPDIIINICWAGALYHTTKAIQSNHIHWVFVGIFCGLGLLGKYTMLLMGLVIISALIIGHRQHFKSIWLYVGGAIAFLILTPNLAWNANHDFVTVLFQLRHGLNLHERTLVSSPLPKAEIAQIDSIEHKLMLDFKKPLISSDDPSQTASISIKSNKPSITSKFYKLQDKIRAFLPFNLKYLFEFLCSQILLMGFFGFGIGYLFLNRRKSKAHDPIELTPIRQEMKPLIFSATLIPIAIFALLSLKGKVEANWSSMYLISAAAFIMYFVKLSPRWVLSMAVPNICAVLAVVIHGYKPLKHTQPADRVLKETHGYKQLAMNLSKYRQPIFTDTYQNASMLRFYDQTKTYVQWPGINRPSQYILQNSLTNYSFDQLLAIGTFSILRNEDRVPKIPSFQPYKLTQIDDCSEGHLEFQSWATAPSSSCTPVHTWYLIDYRADLKTSEI